MRAQTAIGPLVEALNSIGDRHDVAGQQQISTYLAAVIDAMAEFTGADDSELTS